ncbi:MAG TPA: hypothetical protein VFD30_13255 [Terriglobia bacterium]|nr:hypothetical protein [Terriglobia bacterium]
MLRGISLSVLLLLASGSAWTQQRPTLGENPPAPSLAGPRSYNTVDPRKLRRIRTIYVERIENALSDRLAEGISKMGRFRVVSKPSEADAVLRGSCADLRRLKKVHSEVFIADMRGATVWQDVVRQPFNPPPLSKAIEQSATIILQHLAESLQGADRAD